MNNLVTRCISGAVFVSVIIGAMLLHHISFFLVFLAIAVMAIWEFYSLFSKSDIKPQKVYGTILGAIIFSITFIVNLNSSYESFSLIIIPLVFSIFIVELFRNKKNPISNIAYTVIGLLYIIVPFSIINYVVFLGGEYSGLILLGIFLMIWIYDSFAYVFGVTFGKHPLFKRVSPKKSWEGFLGGALVVLTSSFGMAKFITDLSLISWFVIAAIIVIFGTFGDLIESLFKRSILIKDSGNIIPGHGGMLDRFDSVLIALPIIYTYLYFAFK